MSGPLLVALLPWLVFSVAARNGGLDDFGSALLGLVSAVVIAVLARRRRAAWGFEFVAVVAFAGITALSAAIDGLWPNVDDYGRALAAGILAMVALGSLLRRPFTEQYMVDLVPSSELDSPVFARLNRLYTAAWGVAAVAVAASFTLGTIYKGALAATVFNWLVPLVVVLGCVGGCASRWSLDRDDEEIEEQQLLLAVSMATPPELPAGGVLPDRTDRRLRALDGGPRS